MDIVQSIKNEAFKQDISLAEIARKLGMKPQNFNQILRTESVKFSVIQKISKILEVSIDYLLGEKQESTQYNINSSNSSQSGGDGNEKISYDIWTETIAESIESYQETIKIQMEQIFRMQGQIESLIETNQKLIEKITN